MQHRLRKSQRGGAPQRIVPAAYKGRNVVEPEINPLNDFRAIATRYDKRGHNFLAAFTVPYIFL